MRVLHQLVAVSVKPFDMGADMGNRVCLFLILVLLSSVLLVTAGCAEKKAIGEACVADAECDNGFCLDLSVLDESCRGRVCTRGCRQVGDCPQAAADPECRRFGSRSLCFYGGWRAERCRASRE